MDMETFNYSQIRDVFLNMMQLIARVQGKLTSQANICGSRIGEARIYKDTDIEIASSTQDLSLELKILHPYTTAICNPAVMRVKDGSVICFHGEVWACFPLVLDRAEKILQESRQYFDKYLTR